MFSNLKRVLIYSLTKCALEDGFKDSCVLSMTEFTVQEVTVCGVATFLNEVLHQTQFLRNLQIIQYN